MSTPARPPSSAWLDVAKGVAIVWIFLVHFVERFTPGAYFANPTRNWPALGERFTQLLPLPLAGTDGAVVNLLRWVALPGDQGVQIFIVASGVGLAWSALRADAQPPLLAFYRRRLLRIVPMWVVAHLLFLALGVLTAGALSLADWKTWASLVGLRSLPPVMYHFAPAWWFVGLLLQFYLVFPLLMRALLRWGPARFFWIVGGAALLVRAWGLFGLEAGLDWWSRGGFFVTRLPEFVFGMALAAWLRRDSPPDWLQRGPRLLLIAVLAVIFGNLLSFTLAGMAVAFLFTGAGWVLFFHAWSPSATGVAGRVLLWTSAHSLAIFLVHHPVIILLVPQDLELRPWPAVMGFLALAAGVTLLLALLLERLTALALRVLAAWRDDPWSPRRWRRTALGGSLAVLALLLGEAAVRHFAPEEVLGWGERRSMQPDARYGYKLVPDQTTRLRWLSYDYVVQASEIGFPAPNYPLPKAPGTLRILVTGDAYESAEGVDTAHSWPRLLERNLRSRGIAAEVLNLSVTGWGPNQYARAVADFAPAFRPDIVLVGLFVNEFSDAQTSDAQFRASIGFDRPPQDGLWSWVRLSHLLSYLRNELVPRVRDATGTGTYARGFFYGHVGPLERSALPALEKGAAVVGERLSEIRNAAEAVGASTLVLQVPAPAQVCPPDAVDYSPRRLNLGDTARFDIDQPQRLGRQLCDEVGLRCVDLRPAFAGAVSRTACQRANLHWTREGQAAVADFVTRVVEALPAPAR